MSVLRQLADHADMNRYLWQLAYSARPPRVGQYSSQLDWHRSVRRVIAEAAGARKVHLTGSSTRGTAIVGFSDLDHFVELPGSPPGSTDDALESLHSAVSRILARGNVSLIDAPSVTLVDPFSGGLLDFVPAYGEARSGFSMYVAGRGQYVPTNPLAHNSYMNRSSTYVRTLVRLLKSWKYAHCDQISSVYLEMFCAARRPSDTTGDLLDDLIALFRHLYEFKLKPLTDPTSSDGREIEAGASATTDLVELRRSVETALQASRRIDYALRSGAATQGQSYAATLFVHPNHRAYQERRLLQGALAKGNQSELRDMLPVTYMDRIELRRERSKWKAVR